VRNFQYPWLVGFTISIALLGAARNIYHQQKHILLFLVALSLVHNVYAYKDHLAVPQSDVSSIFPRKRGKGDFRSWSCDSERGRLFGNYYLSKCERENEHYRNVHGIIMATVLLILFPIGALSMRILARWWLHAGFQMLSLFLLIAGFGIGVYLAKIGHEV